MQVAMVGAGYVGLVSGACLADVGHTVSCVDVDQAKVEKLRQGISPIYEPGIEKLILRGGEHERLFFTTDLKVALNQSDMVFIAVGTPQDEDGSADVQYVRKVAENIGQALEKDMIVVIKSTVPVGTCDMVERVIEEGLDQRGAKFQVSVCSNPEFLKEGDAIADFMKPDRIVIGTEDETAIKAFRNLYGPFVLDDLGKLQFMDRRSSELTKYAANAMLATRISFMNEMARLCEKLGANVDKVRVGIGADFRIGRKFLFAGPGYGGSCFPKDVAALIKMGRDAEMPMTVLEAVSDANHSQKEFAADKIFERLGQVKDKRIAIWGLAFKPGTDDVRETPAKNIIRKLINHGAEVIAHDPQAVANFSREFGKEERLSYANSAYKCLDQADALVLVTEWSEYKRPNWEKVKNLMRRPLVFDFRNQYNVQELMNKEFEYSSIGRSDRSMADRQLH